MSAYKIIDEPKPTIYSNLVVNPIFILFASILLPLFFSLPWYGRFWIPLVWIVLNGFLLGSPTRIKEAVIAICGCLFLVLLYNAIVFLAETDPVTARTFIPYYRILNQGVIFFVLYLIVFYQSAPYAIHEYLKEQHQT